MARRAAVLFLLAVGIGALPQRVPALRAQARAAGILVIDGGTLIDGSGGVPIRDAQIVIDGDRIRAVGRKGQAAPAGAQVVNADGKFIVPGLWDGLANFLWYQGEIFLNNGVTSFIGIGDMGEVFALYDEGLKRGKLRGPRAFDWPVHFQGPAPNLTGFESPFDSPHPLATVEEARAWTKRLIDLGAYGVSFQNGAVSPDIFKAAVEVAHAAGKPVGIRAGGEVGAREAALLGADFIPRSQGVAAAVTNMPAAAGPAGGFGGPNELEQWAQMDEAKAADLIKLLVQQKTALVPSFIQKAPGLPAGWSRFELQARRLFADPFLMAYYPGARAQTILWNYLDPPDLRPDVVDVRRRGYQNALRFHRMLIEAGGRVLVGTDGGNFSLPGLGVHHEMQLFAEDMRLTPMQIIQAATRWPAETMRAQDRLGTIAAGKLADLLIVDADPLQDVRNLQAIFAVVANGSLQDGKYHASYWNPFQGDGPITLPVVDDIGWAVNVRRQAAGRGGAPPGPDGGRGAGPPAVPPLPAGFGNARQPQPTIETIDSGRRDYTDADFSKVVVKEGGPTLTLKLTGFNYFQRSQVYFNGIPVPTTVNSRVEIAATIDETLLRTPGRYQVVVRNLGLADPANPKLGDGVSNRAWLIVGYR
jgi:imidazolonepropionase-like amidohydrolase